jgi:6-hydroxytryprostatin B O-methyltransferase
MAPSDLATLAVLGNRIAANAILLEKSLESRGLRQPSFNQDVDEDELSTADEDSSASDARVALLEDTQMLHDLILSPAEVLRKICWSVGGSFLVLFK